MVRILLIRHGQTVWNVENRFRGRADPPLDETGLTQAEATARYVASRWPLQAVYASPIGRARQTAQAVARHQGLTVQVLEGMADIDYGQFQGLLPGEAEARYPELYQAWYAAPHTVRFPEGESLGQLQQRAMETVRQVVQAHPDEQIALVGHTVINRVILCGVLGLGLEGFWQLGQDTCALNLIEWDSRRFKLAMMNDTSHLTDL